MISFGLRRIPLKLQFVCIISPVGSIRSGAMYAKKGNFLIIFMDFRVKLKKNCLTFASRIDGFRYGINKVA